MKDNKDELIRVQEEALNEYRKIIKEHEYTIENLSQEIKTKDSSLNSVLTKLNQISNYIKSKQAPLAYGVDTYNDMYDD